MKTYLVGGAVRDQLLGLPVNERDWLVTGTDASELLRLGYRQVGQDFPVFLHPDTHEEYALPRPARGSASGTPASIEADLQRRDLTINAMAMDLQGNLIDPFGGEQDLKQRILRHNPAFRDDPIRVLRLARFAARFQALGFQIAPDTIELAHRMVREGDLNRLVPERVFGEIRKALTEENPVAFIEVLRSFGALAVILPEIEQLFGVPQPPEHHPEIDTGIHSLMVLAQACRLSPLPEVRLAALLHDVGKGVTPPGEWPRHIAHEARGVPLIESLARRLCLPNHWRDLARLACRYHLHAHRALELRPKTLLKLLESLDALRRAERFEQFLIVCEADMRGRGGGESRPYPQRAFLRDIRTLVLQVDLSGITGGGGEGPRIAERIRRARIGAIAAFKQTYIPAADTKAP